MPLIGKGGEAFIGNSWVEEGIVMHLLVLMILIFKAL